MKKLFLLLALFVAAPALISATKADNSSPSVTAVAPSCVARVMTSVYGTVKGHPYYTAITLVAAAFAIYEAANYFANQTDEYDEEDEIQF